MTDKEKYQAAVELLWRSLKAIDQKDPLWDEVRAFVVAQYEERVER